jgi:hypothetical protein
MSLDDDPNKVLHRSKRVELADLVKACINIAMLKIKKGKGF